MPAKIALYDLKEGVVLERWPVTAAECVRNDVIRYTLTKPAVWPPMAKPKANAEGAMADDLTMITGIGAAVVARLNARGIYTFAHVRDMSPDDVSAIEASGPALKDRVAKQRWREQAAELVAKQAV